MGQAKKRVIKKQFSEIQKREIRRLLGNNLREARKNAGLSQTDVTNLIGMGKNRLSEIENGRDYAMDIDIYQFLLFLDIYGQSADYILGRSCEPINDILASQVNSVRLNAYKYLEPLIEAMTEKTISHIKQIGKDDHLALLALCDDIGRYLMGNGTQLKEQSPEAYTLLVKLNSLSRNIRIAEAQRERQMYAQLDSINERHDKADGHMLMDDLKIKHQYTLPFPEPETVIVEVECE